MESKEIILSKIAELFGRNGFLRKNNSEFKSRLKCAGLADYYDKYADYLVPYYYNTGHTHKFENNNDEYDVFLGLDSIFSDLFLEGKNEEILLLLKELTKSINAPYVLEEMEEDFQELSNLYELLGLSIYAENEKILVTTCMANDFQRIDDLFSVESWLKKNHQDVYDSYKSAIDAYTQGHAGACIESCRTTLVSIFSKFKGTDDFAKWMRGLFNASGDSATANVDELSKALNSELKKNDLADFFYENRDGKLTKTKTVYMIYSMMSDYGTHRNEGTKENPSLEDALFSLRLMDSILYWIYSKKR